MYYIQDDDRHKHGNRLHIERDKCINNIERKDKPKGQYLDVSKSGIGDLAPTRLKRTDRTFSSDPTSRYEDDPIPQYVGDVGK